jgi:hypothetical protein
MGAILAPMGLLFGVCCWRFLRGLVAADDIPLRVTSATALWAAMTTCTGLLFALCLFWSVGDFLPGS